MRARLIAVLAVGAMSVLMTSPALAAKPPHLKLRPDAQTSGIFLTTVANFENPFSAVVAGGTLTGCVIGTDNYGVEASFVQDGHHFFSADDHSGSGLASCPDPSGSHVSADRLVTAPDTYALHPGRVRVTITVTSYADSSRASVTRWMRIPGKKIGRVCEKPRSAHRL